MNPKAKLIGAFLGVVALALAAAWVVHPAGSRLDLASLKIPFEQQFRLRLGLDLQGGSHLVYQADFTDTAEADRRDALMAIRDIIERRVNSFGVSEPLVQVAGSGRLIVELPGIKDINEAIRQIGQTPYLEFRTENLEIPAIDVNATSSIQIDPLSAWLPSGLSGKQLEKATVDFNGAGQVGSQVVVRLQFNEEGRKLFDEITSANVGKQVAIVLDGQVISAPVVQSAITDGVAIITGNFSVQVARELATRLNSGALPVPISLVSQQNIGATLGKDSVHKSLVAGLLGLVLVAVFMVVFYRLPGLLAVMALAVYTLLALAVFKIGISFVAVFLVGIFFFLGIAVSGKFGILALISYLALILLRAVEPVTLTLAGIAGFILSIGMAVDANILIFERLKEEIRGGKDIARAVDDGFARAWLSIRDSNVSSLITTVILYAFGTPAIKGFAVTLAIGIFISMFTAISVTRTLLRLFIGNNLLLHPWLFGASKITKEAK